ncbi:uncharacterized protein LOC127864618 isoform X4 [Dreissena polymorpha]|uniref:uncharacterized protein LOC127864618 isoform X4 n=1 Tax=Dreissena polymorpha TaxID=45954 RepID=UPI002264216D|nr:uncharacterized protein LOC127864618 isoform X4 [Dreissena polymorpha]
MGLMHYDASLSPDQLVFACSPVRKEAVHYTVMQGFMVSVRKEAVHYTVMQGFMVSVCACSPVRKEAVHYTVMQGFMVQSSQEGSCPLYSYARCHGAVQSGRKLSTIQLCKVSWCSPVRKEAVHYTVMQGFMVQSSQEGSCPLYSYARFNGLSPVKKEAVHYTVMQGFRVSVQSGRKLSTIQLCKVSWSQSSQEGSCPLYSYARCHGAVQSGRKLSTLQLRKVSWCSPVGKEAVHYTVMQGVMVQSSQEGSCPLYSYARFHGAVQSGRKLSTIQLCKVSWSQSSKEGSCPLYSYARFHGLSPVRKEAFHYTVMQGFMVSVQSGRKLSTIQLCKVSWCSPVRKEAVHYTVMQGVMVQSSQEGSCPLYSYARFHGLIQSGRKLSTIQLCKVSWSHSPVRKEAVHYTVMQGVMVQSSQEGSCPLYSYARFHGLIQSGRKLSTIQLCKVSWSHSPVRKEAVHYTVMQGVMVQSSQEGSCPLYSYARFHGLIQSGRKLSTIQLCKVSWSH